MGCEVIERLPVAFGRRASARRSCRRQAQAERQEARGDESCGDAGDAGRPTIGVEEPAERRAAGETAEEVAGEVEPAGRAAVARGGPADEAGNSGLGGEGPDRQQREPGEERGKVRDENSGTPRPATASAPATVARAP